MNFGAIGERVSTAARAAVAAGKVVPSESRGVFRRVLELSAPRLAALLRGHDLEVTTQRMIVALAASGPNDSDLLGGFANELQVGAGVYVPTSRLDALDSGNRRIDLARLFWKKRVVLPLTEMKGSHANDSPRDALEQVFAGYCWTRELRKLGVPPYDSEVWSKVDYIPLQIIGPADWFARYGGVSAAIRVLNAAQGEIEHLDWHDVGVHERPLVLETRLWSSKTIFDNFDAALIEAAIRAGGAQDALKVLRQDRIDEMRSSLFAALQQAEAN
jgi:hypothetical protein